MPTHNDGYLSFEIEEYMSQICSGSLSVLEVAQRMVDSLSGISDRVDTRKHKAILKFYLDNWTPSTLLHERYDNAVKDIITEALRYYKEKTPCPVEHAMDCIKSLFDGPAFGNMKIAKYMYDLCGEDYSLQKLCDDAINPTVSNTLSEKNRQKTVLTFLEKKWNEEYVGNRKSIERNRTLIRETLEAIKKSEEKERCFPEEIINLIRKESGDVPSVQEVVETVLSKLETPGTIISDEFIDNYKTVLEFYHNKWEIVCSFDSSCRQWNTYESLVKALSALGRERRRDEKKKESVHEGAQEFFKKKREDEKEFLTGTDVNTLKEAFNEYINAFVEIMSLKEERLCALVERKDGQIKDLLATLEKLARFGNGDFYGNSDGNMIAIDALKNYRKVGIADGEIV